MDTVVNERVKRTVGLVMIQCVWMKKKKVHVMGENQAVAKIDRGTKDCTSNLKIGVGPVSDSPWGFGIVAGVAEVVGFASTVVVGSGIGVIALEGRRVGRGGEGETLLLHEPTLQIKSKMSLPVSLKHLRRTGARSLRRTGYSTTGFGVQVLDVRCGLGGMGVDAFRRCLAPGGCGCGCVTRCRTRCGGGGGGGGGGGFAGVVGGEAVGGAELLVA